MERPTLTKEKAIALAQEHWTKAERNRAYMTTADVDAGMGAIALAWYEAGGSFGHPLPEGGQSFPQFLNELHEAAPDMRLMQAKPKEPPALPQLWKNPLTGQPLGAPKTPDERATLAKADPALLTLLDELEKRPYAVTQRLREQEAAALRSKAIKYGTAEHKTNPFVNGATETKKAQFIRETPADVVEFYRNETRPIELPASNLTVKSKIALHPRLHAITSRASEIMRVWNEDERQRLHAEKAKAEAELKRLEAVA